MSPITGESLNGGRKHPEQRRFDSALVEDWRMRRWPLLIRDLDVLKMEIEEIDVASLRKASDRELLSLHRRTHQLWSKVKPYEKRDGLYLVAPHAQWIWEGKKRLIVKSKKFNVEDKKYYLVQDKVYGVIELGAPYSINLEEFKKLSKLHLVSEEERKKWWPDYKTLYAYAIKKFKKFPIPKDYDKVPQAQVFLKDVEPRNKISRSDIEKAHELIVAEILKRDMEHKTPLEEGEVKKTSKSIPGEINTIYDEEYFKGLQNVDLNFIMDFAEITKYMLGAADNVLEMGCGTGRALEILGDSGVAVKGIDVADKAIEMCKELNFDAQKMDAHSLDFKNGMFDVVFSMHLLEHLEDPMMAINESLRVARKRAIHLVPLGKRGDPSHLWEFMNIENLRAFADQIEVASHFHRIPDTDCGMIVFDKELRADVPFFKFLESFVVRPAYISLAGGSIKKTDPDDLDIVVRDDIPNEAMEVAMRNLFPDDKIRKSMQFLYHAAGPHDDSIPLFNLVCQLHPDFKVNRVDVEKRELKPITHFTPLKTGKGYTQLEFFAPEELWEKWAKPLMDEGINIDVERKFGGWRAIAQMDENGKTYIYFDDTRTDRSKQFPSIVSDLKAIGEPVILDLDLGAVYSNGRPVDRVDLGFGGKVVIPESGKFKTKDGLDAMIVGNVFGTLYYDEDLHTKPWSEMREKLEEIFSKHDFRFFKLVKKNITKNKKQFLDETARVSKLPGSEGAVLKAVNSDYPLTGMTPSWAKSKNVLEIKVQVTGRTAVKDKDTWTYDISCLGGNGKLIDLGKTMNTKLDAKAGDIITVLVQEVIPNWDKERGWVIAIVIPVVQNIDPGRKKPETVSKIIVRADKANILQASPAMRDELRTSRISVRKFIEELADYLDEEKRDALRPQPGSREGLAREVVKYIPPHKTYVEPFVGGGRVLMKKEPSEIEVISDLDPEVMFMFKAAKSFTSEEIKKLKNMDWTRTESKWLQLKKAKFKDKLREFYRLMYIRRCSFNYDDSSFARNKEGSGLDFGRIEPWFGPKGRLVKVKLLTCDYAIAIKRFDGPDTFFHIDPPFIRHTESGAWKKWKGFDFERLFKIVKQIKGKWLLAIDDEKEVKKIFSGYHIKELKVLKGSQRSSWYGDKVRTELLISNYKLEKANERKTETTTTQKQKRPEAKLTLKKGDKGDGVIQTHEIGLTEDQVKLLGPDFSFGWDPVEISDSQFDRLNDIQDINWEAMVKEASEGDSSNLGKAINKIDKEKLTIPQRKLIALVDPVGIHSDIRLHPKGTPYWEGGEGFTPGNQFQINKFTLLNKDDKVKILMDFKRPRKGTGRVETIRGPLVWLKIGLKKPQSFPPGSVGSTANAWSRFRVRDSFNWEAGTQDPHYKEFKFDGKILKGRHIMAFAPLPGREQRMWLLSRPGKQAMDEEGKSIVKILKVDEEKRTVLGVVLEPETFDAQNEIISAAVIEKTAHDFLSCYNQKTKLGYMHTFFEPDLKLYESYIASMDMVIEGVKVKKGSWLMLSKVDDDHIWQQVKDKKITGYSIAGIAIARSVG